MRLGQIPAKLGRFLTKLGRFLTKFLGFGQFLTKMLVLLAVVGPALAQRDRHLLASPLASLLDLEPPGPLELPARGQDGEWEKAREANGKEVRGA